MSQPTSIAEWLTTVGMLEYATRFAENDIDGVRALRAPLTALAQRLFSRS